MKSIMKVGYPNMTPALCVLEKTSSDIYLITYLYMYLPQTRLQVKSTFSNMSPDIVNCKMLPTKMFCSSLVFNLNSGMKKVLLDEEF